MFLQQNQSNTSQNQEPRARHSPYGAQLMPTAEKNIVRKIKNMTAV